MTESEIGRALKQGPRLLRLKCIESLGLDCLNRFTSNVWPMNSANEVYGVQASG